MTFALGKIRPPQPRSGLLLPRPQVEQRLVDALQAHRVVLVSAPAGYGKTALLVRALRQLPPGQGVAWVALDAGDDLHRLLECLLAALEPFDPPWRIAPEGLLANALRGDARGLQQAVGDLVNALDACELAHGMIVIDDLHHLDDAESSRFLERLIERLPPRWTLVLSSRHEPAFSLARLYAAGDLARFRQTDLQFTRDEVRALCAPAGLDARAADALHERTAGWAAGLRLALNGARGGSPSSAMDREAFEFLATEVLARIDPDLRSFLLATSVLHELDETRCVGLTGDLRAARWLEEIERLGLFATVTDESVHALRLHDLFREALQHRLRIERGSEWVELLLRAAAAEADPLRRHGLLRRAQAHEQAAADLCRIAWPLMFEGAVHTLLRLCDQLPPDFAQGSAECQHTAGLAHWHVWQARRAERELAQAETLYEARGEHGEAQVARGQRAVILVAMGRLAAAEPVLAPLRRTPLGGKARALVLLCDTWLAMEGGRFGAVAPCFAALLDVLAAEDTLELWTLVVPSPRLTACPGVSPLLGRWADGVLALTDEQPLPLHALALLTRGWQAAWLGQLDEASEQLQRADASARWTGEHVIARSHSQALRALLHGLRGERELALALCRERIAEFPGTYGDWGLWHMHFFACRIATLCGDPAAARQGLERLAELEPRLPDATPARLRPLAGLGGTLAWLEGRAADAMALWRDALAHEDEADLLGQTNEVRVRLAIARLRDGAHAEAAALLSPMLERGGDGPRGALFAPDALQALAYADWQGHLPDASVALLRGWSAGLGVAPTPPRYASAPEAPGTDTPAERLTARELEVLRLIAQGQSNKVIARELDLSPHTVKRHVANALDKLDLSSRGQAAAWYHAHYGARARS